MKKYIRTLYQSMDQSISVRISISYYALTRTKSPKTLLKLYVHVGPLVLALALDRTEVLNRTLRHMLTHLVAFPITFEKMIALNPEDVFQLDSQKATFLTPYKPLEIVFPDRKRRPHSLHSLMESLHSLMANSFPFVLPGRVSIPAFLDMRAMVDCLAMNYIGLLEVYQSRYGKLLSGIRQNMDLDEGSL